MPDYNLLFTHIFRFVIKVKQGLERSGYNPAIPILVAFSGGADSTALLLAMHSIRSREAISVKAVYYNHHIRPEESAKESHHVSRICSLLKLPLIKGEGNTLEYARVQRKSLEDSARELRYGFFATACAENRAQGVLTGHTADDQAETVILQIIRGAGLQGLRGMQPKTFRRPRENTPGLNILRPMLSLKKSDCIKTCNNAQIDFLQDTSNLNPAFTRNRIRNEVLPLLENVRAGTTKNLVRLANVANAGVKAIELATHGLAVTRDELGATIIDRKTFMNLQGEIRTFALKSALEGNRERPLHISQVHLLEIKRLAESGRNGTISIPVNMEFTAYQDKLVIAKSSWRKHTEGLTHLPELSSSIPLNLQGQTTLPNGFTMSATLVEYNKLKPTFDTSNLTVYLDAQQCKGNLYIRNYQTDDYFTPLGMQSAVKLNHFFNRAKVPNWLRKRIALVRCSNGTVWLIGLRIAEWAKITPHTSLILRLQFIKPP